MMHDFAPLPLDSDLRRPDDGDAVFYRTPIGTCVYSHDLRRLRWVQRFDPATNETTSGPTIEDIDLPSSYEDLVDTLPPPD